MRVFPEDSDEEVHSRRDRRRPRIVVVATEDTISAGDDVVPSHPEIEGQEQEEEGEDDIDAGYESPVDGALQILSPRMSLISAAALVPALSNDALCDVMDDTYNKLRAFRLSGRVVSNGMPFMGWNDQRLVDGTSVKFQLRKQFDTSTVEELTTKTWRWLSDPEHVLRKLNAVARGQTLQRVNDDLEIAIHDAVSPNGRQVVRCVYVLCRMRTPRGFIICVRSFNPWAATPSALEPDSQGRDVLFANVLGWFRFDAARGNSTGSGNGGGYGSSSSSGNSSSSDGEIERRRGAPGVRVECAGMVDFGEPAAVSSLATASLWMALQWESLVVAPLFHVGT